MMRVTVFPPILTFLLFFCISSLLSQEKDRFGKLTVAEKNLSIYEKDPDANAVVLYERGDSYFEVINRKIWLVKTYHSKIKILNKKGFQQGTITIPLYKNGLSLEKIKKLRAVTHIGANQYNVLPSEIFTTDINEYKSEQTFTFPKLQEGSIIEYSYTILSPFVYNFRGWDFQSDIPKIYSEFNAKIPGNYVYNRALIGRLNLDVNDAKISKDCFHIDGYSQSAACEVLKYVMKDIPAFKTENEFMLSEKNYISRLDFELSQYKKFDGTTDNYTKSWKDVDQEFRNDKDIGRQLTKKGFFEKNVPESLLIDGDALTRAKNIYDFVKEHYTWTGRFGIYGKTRVKEAFEEKKGNVSEINMSLINLLNASDIKTNLMLLSTRDEGLPKRTHPVMSDFNYAIAFVEIDGKTYLLDATNKDIPFGMLPFRALNHYGRVMAFDDESYWQNIVPETTNQYLVRANVNFNVAEEKAEGVFNIITTGYNAIETNKTLKKYAEWEYIDEREKEFNANVKVLSHENFEKRSTDRKVSERFLFEIEHILNGDMVYFNPFFILFFEENPFNLNHRDYPIDFGYQRHYKYHAMISIPEGYEVHDLPENQMVQLGEEQVTLKFLTQEESGHIGILFDLALNNSYFNAEDYDNLKNIFRHVTNIQKNSLIVLKKK